MPSSFPTSFDALTNPLPDSPLASATVPHATQHTNLNDIIEAIQVKIGLGPAPGGPGASAAVLRRTATNSSGWGQVLTADIADAQISAIKIDPAGSTSKILSTGPGGVVGWNVLTDAMIAADTIHGNKIQTGTINSTQVGLGAAGIHGNRLVPLSVTNGEIATQTIRGGVDGAASKIVPASINAQDFANNTVKTVLGVVGPLTSGQASIHFAGITAAFTHLQLVIVFRSAANALNDAIYMRLQGSVDPAYYYVVGLYVAGGGAPGVVPLEYPNGTNYSIVGACAAATAPAGMVGSYIINLPAYAQGSNYRQWTALGGGRWTWGAGSAQARFHFGDFALGSPINYIEIGTLGGLAAGSYAILYGLR